MLSRAKNDDRQQEIAIWPPQTGNTYIDETITAANLAFMIMENSPKVSASDCDSNEQAEIETCRRNRKYLYLRNYDRYRVEIPRTTNHFRS